MTCEEKLQRAMFVSSVTMYALMTEAGDNKMLLDEVVKIPGFVSAASTVMHLYPNSMDFLKALDAFSTTNGYDKVSKNG